MNTARAIKINYHTKAAYELANSHPCPRSASDVYSLGISLQYCIRAKYIELISMHPSIDKNLLKSLATKQLAIKSEIEKQAEFNLNMQIGKFYNDGGKIMEEPVSEQMVKDVQPFFNRIMSNFLRTLEETADQTAIGKLNVKEMETEIDHRITELYDALGRMFPVMEINRAFADLIEIRQTRK